MATLVHERCAACRRDSPHVTDAEIAELRPQIPGWELIERDGVPRLERAFRFADMAQAQLFARELAALADEQDHHPAIQQDAGVVKVGWWTHAIRGLHRNDFIMAAKTDTLAQQVVGRRL
jgi:4a-hydroxytetrahydrobiopterin dehydratase